MSRVILATVIHINSTGLDILTATAELLYMFFTDVHASKNSAQVALITAAVSLLLCVTQYELCALLLRCEVRSLTKLIRTVSAVSFAVPTVPQVNAVMPA